MEIAVSGPPARLDDPIIRATFEYWLDRRGDRPMPDRAELDPLDMPRAVLPHLLLWDVLPEGGYRCRLAGTAVVAAHGRELRGITTAELHGAANAEIEREYDAVARDGRPHYVERTMDWAHLSFRRYRRLLLPLTKGGTACAMLLSVATYT
jgi:hypothetical protein